MYYIMLLLTLWQNLQSRLADRRDIVDNLTQDCQDLMDSGCISEEDAIIAQVENLHTQQDKLEEQAQQRCDDLASTLEQVQAFKDTLKSVEETLDELIQYVDDSPPVTGDVDAIKDQQEQFKVSSRSNWRSNNAKD